MSIRDGDRLPRRRILTGSDLMIVGDRMPGKRYNGFIKSEFIKENIDETIFMFALFKCGKSCLLYTSDAADESPVV